MKIVVIVIFLVFSQFSFAQNCSCKEKPQLNEIISCEKTIFKNGAKIYYQFNCNSSWLVFESKTKKKKKLFSLDKDLIELTGRLGYTSWAEYNNTFIIENRLVSGCCDPSEFVLFNKNNGKKIANLGREIYHSNIKKYPYFVTIDSKESNFLSFLNLSTNKIFKIYLPKGRIDKTLKITSGIFSETLFEEGEIKNGIFEIEYRYKTQHNGKWLIGEIKVDLNKQVLI
ncbi:hypothetical protein FLA105534_03288 [Flavobacterium bizetiae]|uniref:Uncharacterized protein n=1 Tax=Flavobacterium bizetiae TaxID=2704140 RepID=A0A6J4GRJ2_9FLAO|nr:hypothetical protein [Flavobacterium bizetiae]CAA9200872.1 hypothetical protein FLA105534_03288 [Flavobacterium bizetiae]CAD5350168.1 hypothetical protein FLA105534_04158 [Flavobacterium bizetiae]